MSRYLPIPSTIHLIDDDGNPQGNIEVKDLVKALFTDPAIIQSLGVFEASDLRVQLLGAREGTNEKITDIQHQTLAQACRAPKGIMPIFAYCRQGRAFLKSWIDAPDTEPKAEPYNQSTGIQQANQDGLGLSRTS